MRERYFSLIVGACLLLIEAIPAVVFRFGNQKYDLELTINAGGGLTVKFEDERVRLAEYNFDIQSLISTCLRRVTGL